jgi:hypothetical protein
MLNVWLLFLPLHPRLIVYFACDEVQEGAEEMQHLNREDQLPFEGQIDQIRSDCGEVYQLHHDLLT